MERETRERNNMSEFMARNFPDYYWFMGDKLVEKPIPDHAAIAILALCILIGTTIAVLS